LLTDELGGHVGWKRACLSDFAAYFCRLVAQPVGGPLLHRTEDDEWLLSASRNEHDDIELMVRLLDRRGPHVARRRSDPNRELGGCFIATEVAVASFARQLQFVITNRL
jgi:hypothetical protein